MKKSWEHLESSRKTTGAYASSPGERQGAFFFQRGKVQFVAIVSSGDETGIVPWEHVSVRAIIYSGERCPTWEEMCWIKDQFWDAEECVVQYHPPRSDYVNNHPFVLHLWKPLGLELPRPPSIAVGIREGATTNL